MSLLHGGDNGPLGCVTATCDHEHHGPRDHSTSREQWSPSTLMGPCTCQPQHDMISLNAHGIRPRHKHAMHRGRHVAGKHGVG